MVNHNIPFKKYEIANYFMPKLSPFHRYGLLHTKLTVIALFSQNNENINWIQESNLNLINALK